MHRFDELSWLGMGEALLLRFDGARSLAAFSEARRITAGSGPPTAAPTPVLSKSHRALSWAAAWGEAGPIRDELRLRIDRWLGNRPVGEGADGFTHPGRDIPPLQISDFGDLSVAAITALTSLLPHADPRLPLGASNYKQRSLSQLSHRDARRLHVAFLSSDFGVCPPPLWLHFPRFMCMPLYFCTCETKKDCLILHTHTH
jgi:hypothetical protein